MSEAVTECLAELDRLRARIAELEAELATMRGSMAPPPAPDEPTRYVHNVPPDAPT
jgi:BMFP domain-containing protein YqiC